MASESKKQKIDVANNEDVVEGFIHEVTNCRVSPYKKIKLFNAIIQLSRDEFRNMVIFAPEKHATFLQAEKNRSAVKIEKFKKRVGLEGEDYEVQCTRTTQISVVERLPFPYKKPPGTVKRTVAEVKAMAAKKQVHAIIARVVHVSTSIENVEVQSLFMDRQECFVEDSTGVIKIVLWEKLIGKLVFGRTYEIKNMSTREFGNEQYLTTSKQTEIVEVGNLTNLDPTIRFVVVEPKVVVLSGNVTSVEAAVSRCCARCHAWQQDFTTKGEFHRCGRCNRLQLVKAYLPTVNASVTLAGGFGERDLTLPNTVIKRYAEKENVVHLLCDAQDFEEHLLITKGFSLSLRNDTVIAIEKAIERAEESEEQESMAAVAVPTCSSTALQCEQVKECPKSEAARRLNFNTETSKDVTKPKDGLPQAPAKSQK